VIAAVAAPLEAQVGLGLAPLRIETRAPAGTTHTGTLSLTNEVPVRMRMRAELLDFFLDETATPQFARSIAAEAENSCRQWLTINPMEAEIDPSTRLIARYTLRIPPGLPARSFHCAVGFTVLPPAEEARHIGVRIAVRAVTVFYVVTGDPPIQGDLVELKLEPVKGSKQPLVCAVASFRNRGTMYFRPEGKVFLFDEKGNEAEQADLQALPVLPNRTQRIPVVLKNAVPGTKYTLKLQVDLGTHEIQEASVEAIVSATED
jgi:hypothetical protein